MVSPKDLEVLAGAKVRLMDLSEEERWRMGMAGRRYIEASYSRERVVEMWEALYIKHLRRKGIA